MANYYKEIKKANQWIDEIIRNVAEEGKEVIIDKILLEGTNLFEVSEKVFLKRIELHQRLDPFIKVENGLLYYGDR